MNRLQVLFVKKTDALEPSKCLSHIGGKFGHAIWIETHEEAIINSENGTNNYYVIINGTTVDIKLYEINGEKYLKSENDKLNPNSLLALPENISNEVSQVKFDRYTITGNFGAIPQSISSGEFSNALWKNDWMKPSLGNEFKSDQLDNHVKNATPQVLSTKFENEERPTLRQQFLALDYLVEFAGGKKEYYDNTDMARLTRFITGGDTSVNIKNTRIYEIVSNPKPTIDHLKLIQSYFRALKMDQIVEKISSDIKKL